MNEHRLLTENVLIAACAISAGVHVALAPAHAHESAAMGAGFALAGGVLVAVAGLLAVGAESPRAVATGATALLAGLIGAYGISRTVGLPVDGEGVGRVDLTGVVTQVVQLAGLGAALLLRQELTT
jgi:hypothetical protein